ERLGRQPGSSEAFLRRYQELSALIGPEVAPFYKLPRRLRFVYTAGLACRDRPAVQSLSDRPRHRVDPKRSRIPKKPQDLDLQRRLGLLERLLSAQQSVLRVDDVAIVT